MMEPYPRTAKMDDKSPVLNDLFGEYDPNFDMHKDKKFVHFLHKSVGGRSYWYASNDGQVFLNYVKKYPEIMDKGVLPRMISVMFIKGNKSYYRDADTMISPDALLIKLAENGREVTIKIPELDTLSEADTPMAERDIKLYNEVLAVVEDFTRKSLYELTGGSFYYV